jgi:hypothetical protein
VIKAFVELHRIAITTIDKSTPGHRDAAQVRAEFFRTQAVGFVRTRAA